MTAPRRSPAGRVRVAGVFALYVLGVFCFIGGLLAGGVGDVKLTAAFMAVAVFSIGVAVAFTEVAW